MSVVVVVGGQFGGEGKGKITAYLSRKYNYDIVVRCGGPNSGHTITLEGNKQVVLRQIPAGVVNPKTKLFLASGCLIDMDVLLKEIKLFNLGPDRLRIDKNCVIVEKEDIEAEKKANLDGRIGSTCTGVGYAVAKRVLRPFNIKLAKDMPELAPYVRDISEELNSNIKNKKIIIEGTQGFGLSVYHSPYYPYATSRDTTAAGFLSEVGLSPLVVTDIILVIRTFPIRVGGNSGPLPNEIDWQIIRNESGCPYEIKEYTTVTKRLRRVGRFDIEIVKKAAVVNRPTQIALMGVDYLDFKNKDVKNYDELTDNVKKFILFLENELKVKIGIIGTGPLDYQVIEKMEDLTHVQTERTREKIIKLSLSGEGL